jgi:hypothetical protein
MGDLEYTLNESKESLSTDEGVEINGDVVFDQLQIRVAADLPEQHKRRAVMHEIVHIILYHAGIVEQDESLVILLGFGLVELLRTNRSLVKYLLE